MDLKKIKVLVVDDESGIARGMALALNYRGFDSKAAFSGEEAVAAAAEFTPDVLVSDVLMGGISGIETAIQIRRVFPGIRIILYYAQVAPSDMLEMARAHGFQLFGKHIPPQTLCEMLEEGRPT